ncbi:MAG: FtsX-like permease family protein, partial [Pseudomonadales bacterium]|nr:FtsX-like permease family protein [Pseudomonadales bacterium]
AKRDNRFISFTSVISMAGLTLGVLTLIVVLAVFNGSQGLQRERVLITVPHGDISANGAFSTWREAVELLRAQDGIEAVAPYTAIEALLSAQGYHQVTQVRGIDPASEALVSPLASRMRDGSLDSLTPGSHAIVIGSALANNLRIFTGDALNLVVPRANAAGTQVDLALHRFVVSGIFDVQYDIGSDLAYINLQDSRDLLADSTDAALAGALHLRLKTSNIDQARQTVAAALGTLRAQLPGPNYRGEDWSVTEASLFNALKLEKIMTSFMLLMIVAIGAFNIVSTLVMVVGEKQADIAILRTMGASQRTIMGIFLVQGSVIGVGGIALGAALGSLIAARFQPISTVLESWFNPNGLYLLSQLPAELHGGDVALICALALCISFLATLYPAYKASRILPAQVLRYE